MSELKLPKFGKVLGNTCYFHVSLLEELPEEIKDRVSLAIKISNLQPDSDFNVVKLDTSSNSISLLNYADFFESPFPLLATSWRIDLDQKLMAKRTYKTSLNPPILHRKELLISSSHPQYEEFASLTRTAEEIGLFNSPQSIGYLQNWQSFIQQAGYELRDKSFFPIANEVAEDSVPESPPDQTAGIVINRQLTALTRYGYSAPIQALARYGLLDKTKTIFDYGCGKGDDLRGLLENGLQASGWDPHYCPENPKVEADIVNLGFVINVIESIKERTEALLGAYALSKKLLVVSAMLGNQATKPGMQFNDGILTSKKTFQKYYSQTELQGFIESTLSEEAIPVSPGIFFVFRDKDEEQSFLLNRSHSRSNVLRAISLLEKGPKIRATREQRLLKLYEENKGVLDLVWEKWLDLGRRPDKSEAPGYEQTISIFGSYGKTLQLIEQIKGPELLEKSANLRKNELDVYFSSFLLSKRKPYSHLEISLQRDIKAFYGDYKSAIASAKSLLFQIANTALLEQACLNAAEDGLGYLIPGESLTVHTSQIQRLPAILQVYIACGAKLYGDISNTDLVKIHIHTSKLTLMKFDNFEGSPLPRMIERIKIQFKTQILDYFDYSGEYIPPYLYNKSRFINEEYPNYPEQLAFDEQINSFNLLDSSDYGPAPEAFDAKIKALGLQVEGFKLVPSQIVPNLDDKCSEYFTFRDFIECGETQNRTKLPNLPKNPATYFAIRQLANHVLDPIVDYFGEIELTYGFCSADLQKEIKGRVAPELDQHAAHEQKRNGNYICARLGAACDFLLADENMREVVEWIQSEKIPFDRIYFYGVDKPIHISYGPENSREIIEMKAGPSGKLIPRPFSSET